MHKEGQEYYLQNYLKILKTEINHSLYDLLNKERPKNMK